VGREVKARPAKKPDLKAKGPLSVEVNYVLVRLAGQKKQKWVLPDPLNVNLLELPLENGIDEVQKSDKASKPGSKQLPKEAPRRSGRLKKMLGIK